MRSDRFTDARVPDLGVHDLFARRRRWRAWLAVEAAPAEAEADLGLIPAEAGPAIAAAVERVDFERIAAGTARTSHPLMALIAELTRVVGPPHDAWVHWGATTQNITQTGDILLIREAHRALLAELAEVLDAAAALAERTATSVLPGRTHGQHAVPVTFGFKVATWIDELLRHVERLRAAEPRLLVAMVGGAVGTFASFGALSTSGNQGPEVQDGVAQRLGLHPSRLPARTALDHLAEYACLLAMTTATAGRIGHEVATLMKPEFGEVAEAQSDAVVGSSTMPHKRNPQLSHDLVAMSAAARALVPLALEALQSEHEADSAAESMMMEAVFGTCTIASDALPRVRLIIAELEVDEARMRANTALTGGLLSSESVMLRLGAELGRQHAHAVVSEAARTSTHTGTPFADVLAADPRVTAGLDPAAIARLVTGTLDTGLAPEIARTLAALARATAHTLRPPESL